MRCLSSVVAAQWDLSTCLLWPDFGSSRIASAVGDVLANFSRLSILNSLVKLFFAFSEVFLPQKKQELDQFAQRRISKHLDARKRAQSTWLLELLNDCSGLGLDCRSAFWLSTANQTLGLRSIIPLLPARYRLDQGEKHSSLQLT
jgi:hypothetical protein